MNIFTQVYLKRLTQISKTADAAELAADTTKGTLMTQAAGKVTGVDQAQMAVTENMMKLNPQLRTNAIVNASRSIPFRAGRFVGNGILGAGASYVTDKGLDALGKTNLPGLNRLNTENRPTSTLSDQIYNNFADSARAAANGAAYGAAAAPLGLQGPGAIAGAATGLAVDTGTQLYRAAANTSMDDVKNMYHMGKTLITGKDSEAIRLEQERQKGEQLLRDRRQARREKDSLQSNAASTQPPQNSPEDLGEMSFNMNQGK